MPRIHVCSLARLPQTALEFGARDLITLINADTPVEKPPGIRRHLFLGMSDILEPQIDAIAPGVDHVAQLLEFARDWDRAAPLIVHCWAGVSRSTAAAFIIAAALNPDRDEEEIAQSIRRASPTATPNFLLVSEADDLLGRKGRMRAAITAIGRGEDCFEGVPFALELACA